jgi:hypothetical protein
MVIKRRNTNKPLNRTVYPRRVGLPSKMARHCTVVDDLLRSMREDRGLVFDTLSIKKLSSVQLYPCMRVPVLDDYDYDYE